LVVPGSVIKKTKIRKTVGKNLSDGPVAGTGYEEKRFRIGIIAMMIQ
jgi:hypothetical protein